MLACVRSRLKSTLSKLPYGAQQCVMATGKGARPDVDAVAMYVQTDLATKLALGDTSTHVAPPSFSGYPTQCRGAASGKTRTDALDGGPTRPCKAAAPQLAGTPAGLATLVASGNRFGN